MPDIRFHAVAAYLHEYHFVRIAFAAKPVLAEGKIGKHVTVGLQTALACRQSCSHKRNHDQANGILSRTYFTEKTFSAGPVFLDKALFTFGVFSG